MNWLGQTLASSLGKKLIMAITGLFLILFLTGHLLGNLQLFNDDEGRAFNEYAKFMTTNPMVKALSYLTYISIIIHTIYSLLLSIRNNKARAVGYEVNNRSQNSVWYSRYMGILGTLLLIFIVIHMSDFWYTMHYGPIPSVEYDGGGSIKNLYLVVVEAFAQAWYVALYVIAMVALAFHLSHGASSAFQTFGLSHKKYTPFIKKVAVGYAIIVPVLFALMPIYMYIKSL